MTAVILSGGITEFLETCFIDILANDGHRLVKINGELILFDLNLFKVDKSNF